MNIVQAFLVDFTKSNGWSAWLEALVRNVPGELGFVLRRWVMGRRFASAGEGLAIYPGARIQGPHLLSVGRNCRIGLDNVLQANGGLEMGDDVILGPGVKIWSVNHAFARRDVSIWDQGYEHKKVVIGSGVWIGANAFVMPGANIGAHVIVSAGSVVSGKDVEPYSILAGNPARRIGSRLERAPALIGDTPTKVESSSAPVD